MKLQEYFSKHSNVKAMVHVFVGLGIAWLLCRWMSETSTLVLGAIFLGAGIIGHIVPLVKKG